MRATAEGQMRVRPPPDIEIVRPLEPARVAVGRADQPDHWRTGGNHGLADRIIFDGDAEDHVAARLAAHEFLQRRADQRRLGAQPRHLVGVAQQQQQAVADQRHRGLVPGDQHGDEIGQHLLLIGGAAVMRADRHIHQAVAGPLAPFRDMPAQEILELGQRVQRLLLLLRRHQDVADADQRGAPARDGRIQALRHVEQVAQHAQRHRSGEAVDHVHRTAARQRIQQPGGLRLDHRFQRHHRLGAEGRLVHAAHAAMVGRVGVDHLRLEIAEQPVADRIILAIGLLVPAAAPQAGVAPHLRRLQDAREFLVAEHEIDAARRIEMHRPLLADPVQCRIGVFQKVAAGQQPPPVDGAGLLHAHRLPLVA